MLRFLCGCSCLGGRRLSRKAQMGEKKRRGKNPFSMAGSYIFFPSYTPGLIFLVQPSQDYRSWGRAALEREGFFFLPSTLGSGFCSLIRAVEHFHNGAFVPDQEWSRCRSLASSPQVMEMLPAALAVLFWLLARWKNPTSA